MATSRPHGLWNHPVMRIMLGLSLGIHVLLLLGFQKAFPSLLSPVQNRLYEVELIRPPVEDLDKAADSAAEEARIREEKPPSPSQPLEDTISLNTKDRRYVHYAGVIKERLQAHWDYPSQAQKLLLEGRILLVFTLEENGAMTQIRILDPSGHALLDNEACRAVQAAAPFPRFPEHIQMKRLHIRAAFDYRLTSR